MLASTLTTVFVFLPIAFVTEEAGQLYSDIAIAISASILMSMIVAITLVPAAAGRYLRHAGSDGSKRSLHVFAAYVGDGIIGAVEWITGSILRQLLLIAIVFGVSASIIIFLTPKAGVFTRRRRAENIRLHVCTARLQRSKHGRDYPGIKRRVLCRSSVPTRKISNAVTPTFQR